MIQKKQETKGAILWVENNILYLQHKQDKKATIETANEETRIHRQISNGIKMPLCVDIRNLKSANAEAREYGNSHEVINTYSAVAIIVGNIMTKMIGRFFVEIQSPPYPTELFTTKKKALEWLNNYKN